MKSHRINIHEPSHLSEHNSSVGFTVELEGGWEKKGGDREAGWVRGLSWQLHGEPIAQQVRLSFLFL